MGNNNYKRPTRKNPHFIAGLGDGNVRKHPRTTNDDFFSPKEKQLTPYIRSGRTQKALSNARDIFHNNRFSGSGDGIAATAATEGPWQISAMALICLMGLLVGLFLHLVTDSSSEKQAYPRRGVIRRTHTSASPTKKKKTDEWSKDEQVDDDDDYKADSESQAVAAGGASSSSRYYPYHPRYANQQRQHRHRATTRATTAGAAATTATSSSGTTLHHRVPAVAAVAASAAASTASSTANNNNTTFKGPSSSRHNVAGTATSSTTHSPGPTLRQTRSIDSGTNFIASSRGATPRPLIEGVASTDEDRTTTTLRTTSPWRTARPLSPVSSFASMSAGGNSNGCDEELGTPPPAVAVVMGMPKMSSTTRAENSSNDSDNHDNNIPQQHQGQCHAASSKVRDVLAGSDHESKTPRAGPRRTTAVFRGEHCSNHNNNNNNRSSYLPLPPPPEHESLEPPTPSPHGDSAHSCYAKSPIMLPYIPNLDIDMSSSSRSDHSPERRSHVILNHSSSTEDDRMLRHSMSEPATAPTAASPGVAYPGHLRGTPSPPQESMPRNGSSPQRRAGVAASAPVSNEARKNIIHKRQDITHCTDAESSLMGLSVNFGEITLQSVIGGGGFGEVWKASWRSTPVAVKILTGSAQREIVSKGILEEFAAEINMLKGMRHPNICLYMGACLEPPNRAIITELASNGSLWDSLRLPLSAPFLAADGTTRTAWPPSLYSDGSSSLYSEMALPFSVPPKGTWPWMLVKRVARGAARGMTYLHSGSPPVLHRDLKSANLLLDDSYTCKVCDFGLSRLKAQERSMTNNIGTVQWMAPEVLSNQRYAEPADVYSFGVILWEMLTGECPFEGMSAIQCALAVLNRDERPVIPDWCPSSFAALIRACWEKEPPKRPTFPQILLALDAMP